MLVFVNSKDMRLAKITVIGGIKPNLGALDIVLYMYKNEQGGGALRNSEPPKATPKAKEVTENNKKKTMRPRQANKKSWDRGKDPRGFPAPRGSGQQRSPPNPSNQAKKNLPRPCLEN